MKLTINTSSAYYSKIIKEIGLGVLYFLFLYSIQFVFVPGAIGTRVLIGLAGFVLALPGILTKFRSCKFKIDIGWFRIIVGLALIWCMSVFSNLLNGTSDRSMISYVISLIVILFAGYAVTRATKAVYGKATFETASRYVIIAVVVQMVVALLMFFIPAFQSAILSLSPQTDFSLSLFDETEGFRILGFGAMFFGAGIINGFVLILIAAMMKSERRLLSISFLIFSFLLITFVGSMMSRTTLLGTGLGIGVMFWNTRLLGLKLSRRLQRSIKIMVVISCLVLGVVVSLPETVREPMGNAMEFGFEMFYNYFEEGEMSTTSTDHLGSMYDVYPTNVRTWFIGDGLWIKDPSDLTSYYAGVDVGYTRLVFYFGIIGALCFFYYQLVMLLDIYERIGKEYLIVIATLFIYILALNLKGFADLTQLVSLFLFITPLKSMTDAKN